MGNGKPIWSNLETDAILKQVSLNAKLTVDWGPQFEASLRKPDANLAVTYSWVMLAYLISAEIAIPG